MRIPQPGDPAPPLSLPDEHGRIRSLSDQRGAWTVIYFYPRDDTPGCTTEACQFRDLHAEMRALGAEVWGISPDGAASHAAFRARHGFGFPLLSDEDHAVADAYGAWREKQSYGRRSLGIVRSTFLVDPEGRVAAAWPRVTADGHAAEVLAALRTALDARSVGRLA